MQRGAVPCIYLTHNVIERMQHSHGKPFSEKMLLKLINYQTHISFKNVTLMGVWRDR